MGIVLVFSLAISIGLFMILPYIASEALGKLIRNEYMILFMEGIIRIAIFLGYIVLISRMEDIKRVFMYHGAEHKTINCLEAGVPLTPENVDNFSRLHKRCGTSFIFIVYDHQYGIFLLYQSGYHLVTNRVKIIIFTIGGWRFL